MNVSCNVQLKGTTKQNKGQKEGRIPTSAARSCLCHSGSIDTFELAEGFDFTANSICALYGNRKFSQAYQAGNAGIVGIEGLHSSAMIVRLVHNGTSRHDRETFSDMQNWTSILSA